MQHQVEDTARVKRPSARNSPPLEIERKYLLSALPEEALRVTPQKIEQGYIPGEKLIERLRRVQDEKGVRYFRTVKLGRGAVRIEIEEETTAKIFRTMWPLTRGRRVKKVRFAVRVGKHIWEIDDFRDRDLVLAEVELTSEGETANMPPWIKRVLVRDVTDESKYVNARLAK